MTIPTEEADSQAYAWLMIATWADRDPERRQVHIGRHGLQLDDGSIFHRFIRGKDGRIDTQDALELVARDPLNPAAKMFRAAFVVSGGAGGKTAALPAYVIEDECPKTERNV